MRIFLLLLTLNFFTMAESLDFREILKTKKNIKFLKITYTTRDNEDFATILKKFVRDESIINRKQEMVDKTLKANPASLDWTNLPNGKKIQIFLDIDFIDFDKIKSHNSKLYSVLHKMKEEAVADAKLNKQEGFKGSIFYMASYSNMTQSSSELSSISFLQNSPLTLGLSTSFYPKNKQYTLSSSIYFSYLFQASSNLDSSDVSIPLEIGANLYGEYHFDNLSINLYGGLDFEKFSTFNLEGVEDEQKIYFDQNQVLYLTLGASKNLEIGKYNIFSKLSFSQSIVSTRTVGYSAGTIDTVFTGNKVLFYLFHRVNEKYFVHSLFKYHWMSGPSDITTLRVGVGFGRLLF